jgi:beta-glucosidase
MKKIAITLITLTALAACAPAQQPADESVDTSETSLINPGTWPRQEPVMSRDAQTEKRIADLLSRMTLEEKVGQIIQADISAVTPEQVREYNLGAVLNGGGSAPGGDNRTTPDNWLALADQFWEASTDISDGGVGIPAIWGTDAVHGHSNILGATLFPHNIGLGMANDPDLLYEIGRATALEIRVTGLDWTFAPTVAVARNDRWGRTYESYSEDPAIVAAYAPRIVEGLQGIIGSDEFLGEDRVIASAKHFAGDGGTSDGRDQGNTAIPESDLRDIHAAGYPPAIGAGVQTVMASFNSFHGSKLHGNREMLTDVLVGRMGFDGFVVGDWNGHGQVEGCSNASCSASFNAGLDMFMAPDSWDELYVSTLAQVQSGEISVARLDQAVARILRIKMKAGVFEAGRPSSRRHAGNFDLLGNPEHRAVARDAVRKSLVLLKNEGGLLPLKPDMNVLISGDGAHNIGKQSGGWTLNWQGSRNLNEHFPNGTSIYEGLEEVINTGGGSVTLSEDGSFTEAPDVAIVVFGEDPYAEFQGDRPSVDFDSDEGLELLKRFQAAGIPTVSVFISGRPLWVNPEINASTAFVAAWLPGTEGGGIADVLVGNADGTPRYDFQGRLSFSWPKTAIQDELNVGDEHYDPLFAYGHGLGYADDGTIAKLSEESGLTDDMQAAKGLIVAFGDPVGAWRMQALDSAGWNWINNSRGASAIGALRVMPADEDLQEDTMIATWTGDAVLAVSGPTENFVRETNADMVLELRYQVLRSGESAVQIGMGRGPDWTGLVNVGESLSAKAGAGWQTGYIKLSCFEEAGMNMASIGNPLIVTAGAGLVLQLRSVEVVANPGDAGCTI